MSVGEGEGEGAARQGEEVLTQTLQAQAGSEVKQRLTRDGVYTNTSVSLQTLLANNFLSAVLY